MSTDRNSEFTHFNLVIRLSKVQQSALRFTSLLRLSRCSCGPRDYSPMRFFNCEAVPNFRNLLFSQLLLTIHDNSIWYRNQAGTRLSGVVFFFWWLSGEVKHFVHLIRWNLEAVICRLGQELTTGLEWHNCTSCRFRNWILFVVWFCFHQLVPHWSPISCFLPSPGRLAPSRAEVFVGFRCVRLVQALPSSPPPLVLVCVRRPSALSFPLPFQGSPVPG